MIVANGADRSIDFNISNVNVEHVGGIGLDFIGNVSGTVFDSWMGGNAQGGARFANSGGGGTADGLHWVGGGFRKNGGAGLILADGFRHSYKLAKVRKLATRASKIRDYYAHHAVVKLNIGCGPAIKSAGSTSISTHGWKARSTWMRRSHAAGRYGDTQTRCRSLWRALSSVRKNAS